jgi:hypothetical protein
MLLVNYFEGINKNGEVSNKFSLWITPPGYFFTIWAFIYTGLLIANIYNLIKNVWSLKTHIFFGITNVLNIVWTFVFCLGTVTSVCIASFILITLTVFIYLTWWDMGNIPEDKYTFFTYFNRNAFAFYLGWCIAASNLNFGMDIVYWWGGSYKEQLIVFWIMAPLCALGASGYILWKWGKVGILSCFCLWFSVTWAFIGAGITSSKCLSGNC